MPTFVVVNPRLRKISPLTCETIQEAQDIVGLRGVDHGILMYGLGYCVYEYGLFVPPSEQHYFGIHGTLIAGPAIFYAFDERGETLNLRVSEFPNVRFYLGINDVEHSISIGEVERPFMAVGNARIWEWPQHPPQGTGYVDK